MEFNSGFKGLRAPLSVCILKQLVRKYHWAVCKWTRVYFATIPQCS